VNLTQDQARSIILRRHGLVDPFDKPLEAMRAVFAVQTQYAASLPAALAVRTKGLKANWHKKAEHSDVVKSWTLRNTLHAQTAEDHALYVSVAGKRIYGRYLDWMRRSVGWEGEKLQGMLDRTLEALKDGPRSRTEIHAVVPEWKEHPSVGWGADMMGLACLGKVKLIVTEGGPTLFALHETEFVEPTEAAKELARRYFASYGPATLSDFAYWSGLKVETAKPALQAIEDELTEVQVEGMKGKRWMMPAEIAEDIPKLRLLAKFDPLTMGHADKSLFLDPKYFKQVSRAAGQVEATILANGRMVGTWRFVRKGTTSEVVVEPFKKIAKTYEAGIEREARKIAKSLGFNQVEVRSVNSV